jgi:recombination protein RecT
MARRKTSKPNAPSPAGADHRKQNMTKVARVRDLLNDPQVKGQVEQALPRWMDVNRFTRITMTSLQLQPKLLDCEPISLVSAVMQLAQLGLEPDNMLGHAHLVPFRDSSVTPQVMRVQIILGYRGIIRLARNSDEIEAIEARAVFQNDTWSYRYGDRGTRSLSHRPTEKNPGKLRASYAICRFKGGGEVWEVCLPRHIARARGASASAENSGSPWNLHEEEMWRKTAVRRLEPFLPLTAEARRAFAMDAAGEHGEVQFLDLDVGIAAQNDTESGLDALASEAERGRGKSA